MSTEEEIEQCVRNSCPDVIMHTNSSYPSPLNELNLSYINWLKDKYKKEHRLPHVQIGYSGHEYGLVTTFAAVALGATWIERHVTLDRTMYGSDQAASLEPQGLIRMVKDIRMVNDILGDGKKRIWDSEIPAMKKLREVFI
jgi:N-acetylneuraminate synthase